MRTCLGANLSATYTDLRNRLSAFAVEHPESCRLVEDDSEIGCKEFEVQKGRLSFRLTALYSEERREQARIAAKKNPVQRWIYK